MRDQPVYAWHLWLYIYAVQSRAQGTRYALDTKTLAQFSSRVVLNSGELYSLQMVS